MMTKKRASLCVNPNSFSLDELASLPLPRSVGHDAVQAPARAAHFLALLPGLHHDATTKVAVVTALALLLPLLRAEEGAANEVLHAFVHHGCGNRLGVGFDPETLAPAHREAHARWRAAHGELCALIRAAEDALARQDRALDPAIEGD